MVLDGYFNQYKKKNIPAPNFLNHHSCLTLIGWESPQIACCGGPILTREKPSPGEEKNKNISFLKERENICDEEQSLFCLPNFYYERKKSLADSDFSGKNLDPALVTKGLTVGAVIWLYFYERMGIFKILGILMDDYNYRGKFTLSGKRKLVDDDYSVLMDLICTLYRLGIGSGIRAGFALINGRWE